GEEGKLSLFATGSFSNEYQSIKDGQANGSISPTGVINKEYRSWNSRSYNTNTTGMVNLAYRINPNHKVNFTSLVINTSDQQTDEYSGRIEDTYADGVTNINTFTQTTLFINQLFGEHKLNERFKINWAAGYNKVNEFSNDEIKAVFPLGTLYNDLNFTYKRTPKPAGNAWSNVHQIHTDMNRNANGSHR
ncbi:MAG: hypothetical protein EOP06_30680, partial [Proteobacteria bacterium]